MLCFYVKYCVLRYQVIQAIQVSYDISAENTYKREKKGLLLAARQTKCENLLLLTDHESGEIEEDGHKMKHLLRDGPERPRCPKGSDF